MRRRQGVRDIEPRAGWSSTAVGQKSSSDGFVLRESYLAARGLLLKGQEFDALRSTAGFQTMVAASFGAPWRSVTAPMVVDCVVRLGMPRCRMAPSDDLHARLVALHGAALRPATFNAGGARWPGYTVAEPTLADARGWQAHVESAAAAALRSMDVRYFAGEGGRVLHAIPGLPPLEVVEAARVGTHNGSPDRWRAVRAFLVESVGSNGYDIVFADEAGLELRLHHPATPVWARAVDGALLDRLARGDIHWVDSYTFMTDEALRRGLTPDPDADARGGGHVAADIAATGSLRLWWD